MAAHANEDYLRRSNSARNTLPMRGDSYEAWKVPLPASWRIVDRPEDGSRARSDRCRAKAALGR